MAEDTRLCTKNNSFFFSEQIVDTLKSSQIDTLQAIQQDAAVNPCMYCSTKEKRVTTHVLLHLLASCSSGAWHNRFFVQLETASN